MHYKIKNEPRWNTGYWVIKNGERFHLSCREKECVDLLCLGYSMRMIAEALNLSHRTVEYYLQSVKNKLNRPSKFALVEFFYDEFIWEKVKSS